MAFNELEERISKIRQQNEEIKRRYEEVEEDKKNAAKLNALVQMVPSTDWPERKEPPEYSNPPKVAHKQKSVTKEQSDQFQYHHPNDRRKGGGPPSDPKYNFLADSERDEHSTTNMRDNSGNKNYNRSVRGNFKKRGTGREGQQRGRMYHGTHRDEHKPEYEAWRKERNRIDEDRISRQKTAEGNWRREWDNDKAYLVNEVSKGEGKMNSGDFTKKDHKDGRHLDGNGYATHNRGAYHKSYRGSSRNYHSNHDYHHTNSYDQHNPDASSMNSTSISADERTVTATDKSIKVTLNQSTISQGPVMSVKVNSPSIAGTGRVGPRQRTRVTYSSNSDVEANTYESGSFSRQKSFEDKNKVNHFTNSQKTSIIRRPQSQKKKENDAKSPYLQKKEYKKENSSVNSSKHYENGSQQNFVWKDYKDTQKFHYSSKSPRASHKKMKTSGTISHSDDATNECSLKTEKMIVGSDTMITSQEINIESPNIEVKIDESSIVIEEQLKTDKESNEITLKYSDSSPSNPVTINEKPEELNYDGDVSFTINQDSVSSCENKNIDEKTEKDDPISHMEAVDNNIESANNEKGEINGSDITVDNTIVDSYTSDNNRTTLTTTAQAEEMKTELVKETVPNQEIESVKETGSVQKVELVEEAESVEETRSVQNLESLEATELVQGTKSIQEIEPVRETTLAQETESVQSTELVQEIKLVHEAELVRETTLAQETESVQSTELVQEIELAEGSELVQDTKFVPEIKSVQETESVSETKLVQEIESVPETKLVQETESVPETKLVQETESVPETKLDQETESVREIKLVKEKELVQEPELVKENKLVQEPELVKENKLVQEPELVKENKLVQEPELVKENKLVQETELIQNHLSPEDLNKSIEQNDMATTTSENRSEMNIVRSSEESVANTCVIVKEDETTCYDNKVPFEENILSVDDASNKCAVKNSENSLPKCLDEMSESSPVNKVENHETVGEILENSELQNKNVQPVIDEQFDGSVNVNANIENKEK